jgi:molybdenum cofactor synthesis domain-containing protein
MKEVEIISIGNELLRGVVQDTNTHWIAQRIAARGADLRRAALLPDEPDVVAEEIRAALARRPVLIVTQGGLGPTDDDRTREALSLATGLPIEAHAEAEEIVRRRYEELASQGAVTEATLGESRMRMARLPRGAIALDNQVGTAPGVVLRSGDTTIVALPGVPPELHWIWENPLLPLLDDVLGPGGFAEVTVELAWRDESAIAPMLKELQDRHPKVYVKSRARGFAEGEEVRVTLTAAGESDEEAQELVNTAFQDLTESLRVGGIEIAKSGE